MSRCEVVVTSSGAMAMRDRSNGELMHPVVGPQVEARELYVAPARLEARLREPSDQPLRLLDVGLGAASNAIAAWHVSESLPLGCRPLEIISYECSLDALELALSPAHAHDFLLAGAAGEAARALLSAGEHATARTRWRLVLGDLTQTLPRGEPASADVVFWDPYSLRSNPQLWTLANFRALRRLCREGATVHTYSGATKVRSALLLADFAVGVGVGVGAKQKQTTIAAVTLADLAAPLDRRWLARIERSSAPLPHDAPPDALAQIAQKPQFAGELSAR